MHYSRIEHLVREALSEELTGKKDSILPNAKLVVTNDGKKISFDGATPDNKIIVMIKATGHPRGGNPPNLNVTKQGDLVRDTDLLMAAKKRYHAEHAILALSEERTYKWFMGETKSGNQRPIVFGQIAEERKGVEVRYIDLRKNSKDLS